METFYSAWDGFKRYSNGKNWCALAACDNMNHDKLFSNHQTYQQLNATSAALIAGFTYVILSGTKEDYDVVKIWNVERADVAFTLNMTAFIAAFASWIFGITFYSYASFAGEEHIKKFIQRFHKSLDVPSELLIFSIVVMLISAFVHIGGYYNQTIYYFVGTIVGLLSIYYIYIAISLKDDQWKFLDEDCEHDEAKERFRSSDDYQPL